MSSSVILLLLLLAQLGASEGPCSKLQHLYRANSTDMEVNDKSFETVVRGSGGAARAAAALLLVAIRNVRGYQASLNTTFVNLCDLLQITHLAKKAVVAPAVTWSQKGCNNQGSVDLLTNVSKPAAVSSELRLWAYVGTYDQMASHSCLSKAVQWSFFTNYTEVQECGFITSKNMNLKSNGYSSNYFAVLARNESSNDNEIATELQKRIQASNLPLQIEYFKSDFLMRKKIFELMKLGKSFLFLDENLWSGAENMTNVQPPPCVNSSATCTSDLNPVSAFRIGNGIFMKLFAPQISKIVNNFSPNASQLRTILKIETDQNDFHIEDAACSWALDHDKEFQNMISYNSSDDFVRSIFDIIIILCDGDPLNDVFKNVTNLINSKILKKKIINIDFQIHPRLVHCSKKDDLEQVMTEIIRKTTVAGVITWSWSEGAVSAAKVAERGHLPLLLAGPIASEVQLGPSVRAATGHLTDLTTAVHYVLESCEWSRIAILSDDSLFSKNFFLNLVKKKNLLYRDKIVNYKNIDTHLDELEKADARIFLLNVNWSISCKILCAALKRGMTPTNGFVWIARDWRSLECCNNNSWDSMYHYTINFGWQREDVRSGLKSLQDDLRNLSSGEFMINADTSIFADALLQLGYGFGEFYKKNLRSGYYLRSFENTLKISNCFESLTTMGVAQELKNKNFTLQKPLIFINKWQGRVVKPVDHLKINQNKVQRDRPLNDICKTLFGSQYVRDRPHCATITTGDPFSPHCHDETIIVVALLFILLVTVLYMARRHRLKLLLNRELNMMASLLEIRKHTATSLDKYLVNRNAIKLLHEIGSGTFGRVHFAELQRPGQSIVVVAAKEPRKDIAPTEECEFFHEACVLAPLCHDNIIRLVGICIMNGPPTVLMEHAFYLDLKRYLTERRHLVGGELYDIADDRANEVSDESLTRLACEAAGALTYLTTRRLIHRDVRAANCLIDKKRSLKLGDFGMARELDVKAPEYATIRRGLFPVLWMAPESLQLGVFSFATDIWSLGVLIMEVITLGARPYGDWQPTRVLNYVTAGGCPPLPPDVSKQTSSLLHLCWDLKAELRPSASWVHKYLTQNPRALSPALLKPYLPDPPIINTE